MSQWPAIRSWTHPQVQDEHVVDVRPGRVPRHVDDVVHLADAVYPPGDPQVAMVGRAGPGDETGAAAGLSPDPVRRSAAHQGRESTDVLLLGLEDLDLNRGFPRRDR